MSSTFYLSSPNWVPGRGFWCCQGTNAHHVYVPNGNSRLCMPLRCCKYHNRSKQTVLNNTKKNHGFVENNWIGRFSQSNKLYLALNWELGMEMGKRLEWENLPNLYFRHHSFSEITFVKHICIIFLHDARPTELMHDTARDAFSDWCIEAVHTSFLFDSSKFLNFPNWLCVVVL